LFIDTSSLLGEDFFDYYSFPDDHIDEMLRNKIVQIKSLIGKITQNLSGKVILHNFEVPCMSPLGIVDNKQRLGLVDFEKSINQEIGKYYRDNPQV
jgi:predicted enzyme involved in methoxymalonyl-ACP biosynthesis